MIITEVTEINMTEMKERAKSLGIDPENMEETELIRSIQIAEGCTPCFGTSSGQCDQFGCFFMQSCLNTSLEKSSQAEEHLKQEKSKLTTANEQLQEQYAKSEQAENKLKKRGEQLKQHLSEQTEELTATNQQLQEQISGRKRAENKLKKHSMQLEQHLGEQTKKVATTNKRAQNKITEHEQEENKLKKRGKQLVKRVREQGEELTVTHNQFRRELTTRKNTVKDSLVGYLSNIGLPAGMFDSHIYQIVVRIQINLHRVEHPLPIHRPANGIKQIALNCMA